MSRRNLVLSLALLGAGMNAHAAPSSPLLDFSMSASTLTAVCAAAVDKAAAALDKLAAQDPASLSFETSVRALDVAADDLWSEAGAATFLKDVSTSEEVRNAANACENRLEKFGLDVYTREDLYKMVKAYAAKAPKLEGEDKKLLEKTLLDFRRNGLDLDPVEKERVKILKKQVVDEELAYNKNLDEVKDYLAVSSDELDGLPGDYKARLEKLPDGRFKVTTDYPDYFPFMENAKSPEARRKLEAVYQGRAFPQNTALIEEAVRARSRIAKTLGYKTWADYVLSERMAKEPKNVTSFLAQMRKRLVEKGKPELDVLLGLKRKDEPKADKLFAYDYLYYHNQLKKAKYDIDDEKVKEYFPMQTVTDGMLAVYQKLFDVKFEERTPAEAWHPDVKLYSVKDAQSGDLLGWFYMDLFPRDGKYKHAACFTLVGGRREADGSRRPPVASIVANFNKPTAEAPSLLKHDEVETYFHEFGHVMHDVLTQSKHPRFSGTRTAQDFVEAPSQMLENWVWNAEVLKSLSGHYKDPSKKLPDDLLKRMLEAKNLDSGLRYLRQVLYASVDMAYHSSEQTDAGATYAKLYNDITMFPMTPGNHPEASFGHLMGGYDAAYYGYLWSEVFAADMFARFEKEGVLNAKTGRDYRALILEPGGGLDEAGQLKKFLGREPNENAFLKSIGLGAAAPMR